MVKLGVNIDHVATVRQARGTVYPSVVDAAMLCQEAGAHGITVHLREDRRHIQDADVHALKRAIGLPLNLELANVPEIIDVALDVQPREVCFVPERREELTTEGGLDVVGGRTSLAAAVSRMQVADIGCSMFIDPAPDQVRASADIGAPIVEFHTGTFCETTGDAAYAELERLLAAAELAHEQGLQVNAGHGIHLGNLDAIMRMPHLDTLNIGHSIVSRAVLLGMKQAVSEMLERLAEH